MNKPDQKWTYPVVRFLHAIWDSGSAEYANLKICILRNELFEDCDYIELVSSDSLMLFVYTTRCSNDFEPIKTRNKTAVVQNTQIWKNELEGCLENPFFPFFNTYRVYSVSVNKLACERRRISGCWLFDSRKYVCVCRLPIHIIINSFELQQVYTDQYNPHI